MIDSRIGQEGNDPETLLHRARLGDAEALSRLLGLYRSYLRLCSRVQVDRCLQSKADLSDLIQETMFIAHRSFHEFRGDTERELVAWLRQILVSRLAHLIRRYKTHSRNVRLEVELSEGLDRSSLVAHQLASPYSTPSRQAARREEAVLLADAIAELSEDHREVLVLHHFQHLPFDEVAARMARSEDATKKLWVRALLALKQRVEQRSS
jgi:RNA polymerase sigma-70 factor (ECF subfamily)